MQVQYKHSHRKCFWRSRLFLEMQDFDFWFKPNQITPKF